MKLQFDISRLKQKRLAAGITQQAIANYLGWSKSTYACRENGIVLLGADELMQIARVYGMKNEELGYFFT